MREVKEKHKKELLSKRNVLSCGLGNKITDGHDTGELCIVIGVQEKVPEEKLRKKHRIPKEIDGIKTDVIELGEIVALQNRVEKARPTSCGVSIGHKNVTAGTLGCLVRKNGEVFILSNNHVLANSNEAEEGDAVFQPGRADGGTENDILATLHEYVPIDFGRGTLKPPHWGKMEWLRKRMCRWFGLYCGPEVQGPNLVDAALAKPLSPDLVRASILEIGPPSGSAEASVGASIRKHGRTTGYTTGKILQTDLTIRVGYGLGLEATFEDQLLAGDMSAGGDSGSAVLAGDNIIGLLFAGSDKYTIINPIRNVLKELEVEILV